MKRERLFGAFTSMGVDTLKLTVAVVALLLVPTLGVAEIHIIVAGSSGDVGKYSSIAVDSQNCSHISYYDATHRRLMYVKIDSQPPAPEVVDSPAEADVGTYSAIAVDGRNVPHISYYDATNKNLKYAVKRGSTWTIQTVDAVGNTGLYTSITVDQFNNPFISYYDDGNKYLKLAYKEVENGNWETQRYCRSEYCEVQLNDGESGSGRSTVIKLEHLGSNPLILFFDFASKTLKLAIFDRTLHEWGTEDIKNASVTFQDLSLALDTQNQPHVAYSEESSTGSESVVSYGMKKCSGSGCLTQVTDTQPTGEGTWEFEQVAAGNSVSLALDRQNRPWVSYYDLVHGLRLADKIGTAWSVQTVDPGWEVGLYDSIALDGSNNPHISYYDHTNGDLKYASTVVPPQRIDVWIKDCPEDNGSVPPTSICTQWWSSPDIWFDNNGDPIPDTPVPGVSNTLKARVRYRGFITPENVTVKFYLIGLRRPLPVNIDDVAMATLIGQRVVTVTPNQAVTPSIYWIPPAWIRTRAWCIGVVLDSPVDHPARPLALPPQDNNFAVHDFSQGYRTIEPLPWGQFRKYEAVGRQQ